MSEMLPLAAYLRLAAQIPYTPRPKVQGERGERGRAEKAATPARPDMAAYMRRWRRRQATNPSV